MSITAGLPAPHAATPAPASSSINDSIGKSNSYKIHLLSTRAGRRREGHVNASSPFSLCFSLLLFLLVRSGVLSPQASF